jgi:hypothetical protein
MAVVRLKAGESVLVAAAHGDEKPDHELPKPEQPVDPGYGIDLGLGYLRPTHPIVIPPGGIPTHPIELPPPAPVDPAYGIDADQGYLRPTHPIVLPGKPELKWELKTAWTESTGWVVVAVPIGPTPTPSRR